MTTVVVTPTTAQDLEDLIKSHSLPIDTIERFKRSVAALETFPLIGANLEGRWTRYRFVLGPWRWMLIVYIYDEAIDRVAIATIQDGRSSRAATGPASG
jgi:plasmid stabilization system protein ParE